MKTVALVHWISYTTQQDVPFTKMLPALNHKDDYEYMSGGMNGYNQTWRAKHGAIIMRGGNANMGTHVTIPGSMMDDYRAIGISEVAVLRYIGKHDAKISRLDIAIDIYDGNITPGTVLAAWRIGDAIMPVRVNRTHKQNRKQNDDGIKGHTEEFGSRTSHRFLRVYNKGAEQGTGENWIRFELELHKLRAHSVARKLQDDDLDMRPVINAEMSDFIKWNNRDWQKIIKDKQGTVERFERKVTNTYKWLMTTVAKALARYELDNPDENVLEAFITAYEREKHFLTTNGDDEKGD